MVCNAKVILLCGFEHGGTSLVWNVITSHPDICSAGYETGELFRQSDLLRACRYQPDQVTLDETRRQIDRELCGFKMRTLAHPDDKFRAPGLLYTPDEVAAAALCLKSVNDDIFLTQVLQQAYPDLYIVALTRNAHALCDGYLRRGRRAVEVARTYQRIGTAMQRLARTTRHFTLVRFEDVLADPFAAAARLFRFLDVQPVRLDKLRIKSKKVIGAGGEHATQFGDEHRKYWFDRTTVTQALATDVNVIQAARLLPHEAAEIDRVAGDALRYFGYTQESSP